MDETATPPPQGRRRWIAGLLVLAATVAITGFFTLDRSGDEGGDSAGATTAFQDRTRLEDANDLVTGREDARHVELGDDGRSLFIDGAGSLGQGASMDTIALVLAAIDAPDATVTRMERTRALDGMQEASWSGFYATWTYHPDDGLDVIVEER